MHENVNQFTYCLLELKLCQTREQLSCKILDTE